MNLLFKENKLKVRCSLPSGVLLTPRTCSPTMLAATGPVVSNNAATGQVEVTTSQQTAKNIGNKWYEQTNLSLFTHLYVKLQDELTSIVSGRFSILF